MAYYIIAAIAILLIIAGVAFYIRIKRFRPNPDKAEQLKRLNEDIAEAGFAYDYKNDYFYSLHDCWQREAGYCRLYDEGSPLFNMIMDCEPVTFSYGGKRWLIELWKGQYGITTGAEIGVYNTSREDVHTEKFTGTFYEAISDEEQLDIAFVLLKNGKKLLKRSAHHWWLTAFKLGEYSDTEELVMKAKIRFPNDEMCEAFTNAMRDMGYSSMELTVRRRTVRILYTSPHSKQPYTQEGIGEDAVSGVNENNCKIFNFATAKYPDTMDKLEYVREFMPELYDFMLRSLYGQAFFKAFEWLLDLIYGHRPPKPPVPPCPPDPPCPPEPTCPPPKPSCKCSEFCRCQRVKHCERLNREYPGYRDYRRGIDNGDCR